MFIEARCKNRELRQEFHGGRSTLTHFTPDGVRLACLRNCYKHETPTELDQRLT